MDMLKDERFDFTILENDVIRDTNKFSKNEVLAYIAISFFADKQGQCFPSYETIASVMRTSRTTAINAVQGLVEKGIIKLENRKADEKKKELTSNLYTLVSNSFWEQIEKDNKIYLAKKGADYKKRYIKGKATKIANQIKENDKKNTPVCSDQQTDVDSINNSNNSNVNNSIPQSNNECIQESSDKIGQDMPIQVKMLLDAGIKYVPYKKDLEMLSSLDVEILEIAIAETLDNSHSKSWKYVLSVFDTIQVQRNKATQTEKGEQQPVFKPAFTRQPSNNGGFVQYGKKKVFGGRSKIGNRYFDEIPPDEFDKMFQEMQKQKWGR